MFVEVQPKHSQRLTFRIMALSWSSRPSWYAQGLKNSLGTVPYKVAFFYAISVPRERIWRNRVWRSFIGTEFHFFFWFRDISSC